METINPTLAVEKMILLCNKQAMDHLRLDQFESALSLLLKAESSLSPSLPSIHRLQVITLNNLGCYYKRMHRPAIALTYLRRALQDEEMGDANTVAGTHLNVCAIRSSLGAHEKALEHAKKAIRLLAGKGIESPSFLSTLLIAYHNAGIEYEFLHQYAAAGECYSQGYAIAKKTLGPAHPLSQNLKKASVQLAIELKTEKDSWRSLATGRNSTPRNNQQRPKSNGMSKSPFAKALPRIGNAMRKKRRKRGEEKSIDGQREKPMHSLGPSDVPSQSITSSLDPFSRPLPTDRPANTTRSPSLSRPQGKERVVPPPSTSRPDTKSYKTKVIEAKQSSKKAESLVDERISIIDEKLSRLEGLLKRFADSSDAARKEIDGVADRDAAAVVIQKWVRGWTTRRRKIEPRPPEKEPDRPVFRRKQLQGQETSLCTHDSNL